MKLHALLAVVSLCFLSGYAVADEDAARRARASIQWLDSDNLRIHDIEESIQLRTTQGMHQGRSNFCWVFGAMGMLESYFLEENPEIDSADLELSRWAFREETGSRLVPGVSVDAIDYYSERMGLYDRQDYDRRGATDRTTFLGDWVTPMDLREVMVEGRQFWSYGFDDDRSGWHRHVDRDARNGTQSYIVPDDMKEHILVTSLKSGKAVTISVDRHVMLLYGVDLDEDGLAVRYYIKDSYSPYFLTSEAARTHDRIWEITSFANAHLH